MKMVWTLAKKQMSQFASNNKGVTLVELLVVVSIMSVLLSVVGISMAITPSTEAKRTIASIDSTISRTKVGTLTKTGDVYMEIYSDDRGAIWVKYYENDQVISSDKLSSGNVTVSYSVNGSVVGNLGNDNRNKSIYIAFDRRTGGFTSLEQAAYLANGTSATANNMCDWIYVKGGPMEYNLKLGAVTGTHTLNADN